MITHPDRTANTKLISRNTRLELFDWLSQERILWCGRLEQADFLSRLYDLKRLPSADYRFDDARGDIVQHTSNNDDWEIDWVLTDPRFELLDGRDELFLNFIEQSANPSIRANVEHEDRMISAYNKFLVSTPFRFVKSRPFADRYVYEWVEKTGTLVSYAGLTNDQLTQQPVLSRHVERISADIQANPDRAIGAAKNLLESLSRQILSSSGIEYTKDDNVQKLFKLALQSVRASEFEPKNTSAWRESEKIAGALSGVVNAIRELRNELGDGHGREEPSEATPIEARLIANAAITASTFLSDLFHAKMVDPSA